MPSQQPQPPRTPRRSKRHQRIILNQHLCYDTAPRIKAQRIERNMFRRPDMSPSKHDLTTAKLGYEGHCKRKSIFCRNCGKTKGYHKNDNREENSGEYFTSNFGLAVKRWKRHNGWKADPEAKRVWEELDGKQIRFWGIPKEREEDVFLVGERIMEDGDL